jgi:hypothetical protein
MKTIEGLLELNPRGNPIFIVHYAVSRVLIKKLLGRFRCHKVGKIHRISHILPSQKVNSLRNGELIFDLSSFI